MDQLSIVNGYSGTLTLEGNLNINNGGSITSGTIDQPIGSSTIAFLGGTFTIANATINEVHADAVGVININAGATVSLASKAVDSKIHYCPI